MPIGERHVAGGARPLFRSVEPLDETGRSGQGRRGVRGVERAHAHQRAGDLPAVDERDPVRIALVLGAERPAVNQDVRVAARVQRPILGDAHLASRGNDDGERVLQLESGSRRAVRQDDDAVVGELRRFRITRDVDAVEHVSGAVEQGVLRAAERDWPRVGAVRERDVVDAVTTVIGTTVQRGPRRANGGIVARNVGAAVIARLASHRNCLHVHVLAGLAELHEHYLGILVVRATVRIALHLHRERIARN